MGSRAILTDYTPGYPGLSRPPHTLTDHPDTPTWVGGRPISDLLEQSAIDALLNATADDAAEDDGVVDLFSRFHGPGESVKIEEYDFRRPDRIGKDQLRSLQTLHDTFARNLAGALSGMLRNVVEVKISDVEQTTYAEFRDSLPRPTCITRIDPGGLDGSLCVELSPLLVYPIVDRLMGGSAQSLFIPQRAMTFIEQQLVRQVLDLVLAALNEAWASVRTVDFKIGDMETNPHVFQIALPNDVVVLLTFDVSIVNRSGTMTVCYPFNAIEPVLSDLADRMHSIVAEDRGDDDHRQRVADQLGHAQVDVAALLAQTTITMSELQSLEVGDVIATEVPASSPVSLLVEHRPKFHAVIGSHRRNYAVRIERRTDASERQPSETAGSE